MYAATPRCHVPVVGYTGIYLHKPNTLAEGASVPISIWDQPVERPLTLSKKDFTPSFTVQSVQEHIINISCTAHSWDSSNTHNQEKSGKQWKVSELEVLDLLLDIFFLTYV